MNRSARYTMCLLLGVLSAATLGPSESRSSWALANGSASAPESPDGLYPPGFGLDRLRDRVQDRAERGSPGNRCSAVARSERV